MNERIKELAKQAGLSHMPSNYPDMADLYKGADYELAKFAELIVRECVEVVKWTPSQFPNDEYVKSIREHFGVE